MTSEIVLPLSETQQPLRSFKEGPGLWRSFAAGSSAPAGPKSRGSNRMASGSVAPFLHVIGTLLSLFAMVGTFWLLNGLEDQQTIDLRTAKSSCAHAVARHAALPFGTSIVATSAVSTSESWHIQGYAGGDGSSAAEAYDWTCRHYLPLGVSKVLEFMPQPGSTPKQLTSL